MNYGLIKNEECINAVVLDTEPTEDDRAVLIPAMCDEIVPIPLGFWIGDHYINEAWSKAIADTTTEPTIEEYVVDLDYRLSMVELGL